MTEPKDRSARWAAYYDAHEGRAVSPLLKQAVTHCAESQGRRQAVDLGCGAGQETRFLLDGGWNVLAIDREATAIQRIQDIPRLDSDSQLDTAVAAFEALPALPASDLIHAGLSLPFCHPQSFAALWEAILSALKPGGVFVGQLFGDRDGWASNPNLTFHSAGAVDALLVDLNVQHLREVEEEGRSMQGPKHWHRIDIIASKPS